MKNAALRSAVMSPERTDRLIAEVKAWCQRNKVKKKDLAAILEMTPQALNDVLSGRNQPSGEKVLHLQEIINTPAKRKKPKSERESHN
jgi:transcriptional regulator with XRE-family HTH domain